MKKRKNTTFGHCYYYSLFNNGISGIFALHISLIQASLCRKNSSACNTSSNAFYNYIEVSTKAKRCVEKITNVSIERFT